MAKKFKEQYGDTNISADKARSMAMDSMMRVLRRDGKL